MEAFNGILCKFEFIVLIATFCIYDFSCCTTNAVTTTTAAPKPTTLASDLKLHDVSRVYVIAGSILIGIPVFVICCCLGRSLVAHRREKKITDDDDLHFQHPPPSHPVPRPFLQRDNTIAGPFQNQAFNDDDDDKRDDDTTRVVTPSFISTRIVNEPGFGFAEQQRRYQYIP